MTNDEGFPAIMTLSDHCTGPNKKCRADHRAGRSVHVIPVWDADLPTLIMPSWHFHTTDEGIDSLQIAWKTAIRVKTDNDLFDARRDGMPHILPIGWIDPERRR